MRKKSFDESINEIWEMISSREFWILTSIGLGLVAIVVTGMVMLTNFEMVRMSCGKLDDLQAYLMFNVFVIFIFGALTAMGEGFTYFDNKKVGAPTKKGYLLIFLGVAFLLGIIGLVMLKLYC